MASLHPADRVSSDRPSNRSAPKGGIHPSICLLTGFGFIAAAGLLTHALFQMIL